MRWIPPTDPFVIAELGACHDGHWDQCDQLITAAEQACCQAIKIQFYDPAILAARRRVSAEAQQRYARYAVPKAWLPRLRDRIDRLSNATTLVISVYDPIGLAEALPYADVIKVASFESAAVDLLEAVSTVTCPVLISTGLSTHDDLQRLLAWRDRPRKPGAQRALLHCVSAYPCPLADARLGLIRRYDLDGFSDHTGLISMGGLAVASGARILEVHCRLTRTPMQNPDYPHALTERALIGYVLQARDAALACRTEEQRTLTAAEQTLAAYKVTNIPKEAHG